MLRGCVHFAFILYINFIVINYDARGSILIVDGTFALHVHLGNQGSNPGCDRYKSLKQTLAVLFENDDMNGNICFIQ